jgi:HK97 gp10 family phage protein
LNIRVYAGSKEVFYARFVEYGTAKMKARPYLRPALNEIKSSIIGIMESG